MARPYLGAIVGLYARYREALSSLKEGWWRNASHLETLSALAVWRQWIDDAGRDPREELALPSTTRRLRPPPAVRTRQHAR